MSKQLTMARRLEGEPGAPDISRADSLPRSARTSFFEVYGPIDEACRLRARVLAVRLCAVLARYARSVGYAGLEREALAGFERALTE